MKFIISGRNIDITDGLRSAVEDKLGKLEKFFTDDTEIHVTLSVEKERQKIEVTIPVKGNIIRSEQVSNDMYVSIDLVEEIIERQLRKYKEKNHRQKTKTQEPSSRHLSRRILKMRTPMRLRSSVPRNSDSNPCIRKTHVYRWNFWDTTSSYF